MPTPRKYRIANPQDYRNKIQTGRMIQVLEDHVFKGTDLKKTQVSAAIALLRKTIPDLQSVDGKLNVNVTHEDALGELE